MIVAWATLPTSDYGAFLGTTRIVLVSQQLRSADVFVKAAILAHELRHAVDFIGAVFASATQPLTPQACYQSVENVYTTVGEVWNDLWQGQLAPNASSAYAEMNAATRAGSGGSAALVQLIQPAYQNICQHIGS